eukprot:TRINITY_DN7356_c0_g1_i1.p1 TRINITY_DN7356_c0_g1~~TRINITY_DN7356_c0_g1_i1.p1  ORF type:complete len:64 (+),score=15.30 TRINITY_DN7356_c0_g1_i1:547-738(+)
MFETKKTKRVPQVNSPSPTTQQLSHSPTKKTSPSKREREFVIPAPKFSVNSDPPIKKELSLKT